MEELDPNLKKEWEERLAKEGLPERPKKEDALSKPRTVLTGEELSMVSDAMWGVFSQYSDLPPKIQEDILEDVYARNAEGLEFSEIAARVKILVQKGQELVSMTSEDSDKYYRPKPSPEELKLNGETKKLIEELQRRQKEKEQIEEEKKKDKPEHDDTEEPKHWVN